MGIGSRLPVLGLEPYNSNGVFKSQFSSWKIPVIEQAHGSVGRGVGTSTLNPIILDSVHF